MKRTVVFLAVALPIIMVAAVLSALVMDGFWEGFVFGLPVGLLAATWGLAASSVVRP